MADKFRLEPDLDQPRRDLVRLAPCQCTGCTVPTRMRTSPGSCGNSADAEDLLCSRCRATLADPEIQAAVEQFGPGAAVQAALQIGRAHV